MPKVGFKEQPPSVAAPQQQPEQQAGTGELPRLLAGQQAGLGQDLKSLEEMSQRLATCSDRFERVRPAAPTEVEPVEAKPTIDEKAKEAIKFLIEKNKYLDRTILEKKKAIRTKLNASISLLSIALNFRGKDLKEVLEKAENGVRKPISTSIEMPNTDFLQRAFYVAFGNRMHDLRDWLKVTVTNRPPRDELLNLFDYYQEWLSKGQELYGQFKSLQTQNDQLLSRKSKANTNLLQFKKIHEDSIAERKRARTEVEKTEKKLANRSGCFSYTPSRIDIDVEYCQMNLRIIDKCEENLILCRTQIPLLQEEILLLEEEVLENGRELNQTESKISHYESKLTLLKLLLGYDIDHDGDPQRVQLIQRAIKRCFDDFDSFYLKHQAMSDKVFALQTEMQVTYEKFRDNNSFWDKIWLKRKLNRLIENTYSLLKHLET